LEKGEERIKITLERLSHKNGGKGLLPEWDKRGKLLMEKNEGVSA